MTLPRMLFASILTIALVGFACKSPPKTFPPPTDAQVERAYQYLQGLKECTPRGPANPTPGTKLPPKQIPDWKKYTRYKLKEIKHLNVSCSNFGDEGIRIFSDFKNIAAIDFRRAAISEKNIHLLRNLPNLEWLSFTWGPVRDRELKIISGFPRLKTLLLGFNAVSDEGLRCLRSLRTLKRVDVSDTYVTEKGMTMLKKSLPGLDISKVDYDPRPGRNKLKPGSRPRICP